MSDRFEKQFKHHYVGLFGGSKGFTDYYEKMKKRTKFVDKYNSLLLAAACFYNEKMADSDNPEKSAEILSLIAEYISQRNEKVVLSKHKRELMMDVLRYYKVLTRPLPEESNE